MEFDHGVVKGLTDESGSFWCEVVMDERQSKLKSITLTVTGEQVSLTEDLYPNQIHSVRSDTIVVSDLDDTLIHSFISNKLKQVKTLLFLKSRLHQLQLEQAQKALKTLNIGLHYESNFPEGLAASLLV